MEVIFNTLRDTVGAAIEQFLELFGIESKPAWPFCQGHMSNNSTAFRRTFHVAFSNSKGTALSPLPHQHPSILTYNVLIRSSSGVQYSHCSQSLTLGLRVVGTLYIPDTLASVWSRSVARGPMTRQKPSIINSSGKAGVKWPAEFPGLTFT